MEDTRTGTTDLDLVAVSPSGEPLFGSLSSNRRLTLVDSNSIIWSVDSGGARKPRRLHVSSAKVTALATTHKRVLVGRVDGAIEVIDVEAGTVSVPFESLHRDAIAGLDLSEDGQTIIIGTRSGRLFQGRTIHKRNPLTRIQTGPPVTSVAVSRNGDTFAVSRSGGQVEVFNTSAVRTPLAAFTVEGAIEHMVFSPDGYILATLLPKERTVQLYHVFTGRPLMTYAGSRGKMIGIRFTDDHELLGLSSIGTKLYAWDLQRTLAALPR
jgi:WD40 repeat protein